MLYTDIKIKIVTTMLPIIRISDTENGGQVWQAPYLIMGWVVLSCQLENFDICWISEYIMKSCNSLSIIYYIMTLMSFRPFNYRPARLLKF